MNIARIIGVATVLLVSARPGSGADHASSFSDSTATGLLDSYLEAIAVGDTVAAGRCWARESLDRPGFWRSLHIEIGSMGDPDEFKDFLAGHSAVVTGVRPDSDAWRLDFEWRLKSGPPATSSEPPSPMHYYAIRQDERFVFVNPIDLLPRTWRTHDEGFCRFHYPQSLSSVDADGAMRFMAARCRELAEYLGSDSTRRVEVYIADTAEMVGELILFPRSGGYCVAERNLVISPTFVNPHEVVHLFSLTRGYPLVNGPITEGIAVALGGTHSSTPDFCLVQARNFLGDSLYVPLTDLVAGEESAFFDNAEVTYLEAGAWVRFLLDRYGYPKLVEWNQRCRSGATVRTAFSETYGSSLEEVEAPWKEYLGACDLPSVGTGIPAAAEVVFSVDDAAGDDRGDGAYRYPTNPGFREGTLDLRRFEVLRDERNAYFRLEFGETGRPVKNEATGHAYTPGAIIALQRRSSSGPDPSHALGGITFEVGDGFDLQINVGTGIMVYDPFGRSIVASRAIRLANGSGCGKIVEFSLPTSFFGSPSPAWKYFVGAVVMDDEALTYLRSYPEPVSGSEAPFSISGGRASAPPPFMDLQLPASLNQQALLGGPTASGNPRRVVPLLSAFDGNVKATPRRPESEH